MSLRDALLKSLQTLPGAREFHIHVLISAPRKHSSLFPYAHPRPRVYIQDILVLLSEQATPDSPRVLVTGIEACLYNVPVNSCTILYISKVDSTGQALFPSPTATLVRSFLTFYTTPSGRPVMTDHLWIHVFARAQNQYLFPNSSEYSGKRPLSDLKLCAWWKRILSEVTAELESQTGLGAKIRLHYILPGYNELEASQALTAAALSARLPLTPCSWHYGHPYSQTDIPLPCSSNGSKEGTLSLGNFIPSFDDDPKSRFMDEIAYTTEAEGVKSPQRKRSKTAHHRDRHIDDTAQVAETSREHAKEAHLQGELNKVSPDEFWERMSFRQECISGAVTGFFVVGISCPSQTSTADGPSPLAPEPGQVSSQINKRIMATMLTGHEFSTVERSVRATELLEGAIKGLCEGISAIPATSAKPLSTARSAPVRSKTPERDSLIPPAMRSPPRTPPRRVQAFSRLQDMVMASPNPFPDPETSLETYHSYIYGSVSVNNPPLVPKLLPANAGTSGAEKEGGETKVTVLTARKKKKRSET